MRSALTDLITEDNWADGIQWLQGNTPPPTLHRSRGFATAALLLALTSGCVVFGLETGTAEGIRQRLQHTLSSSGKPHLAPPCPLSTPPAAHSAEGGIKASSKRGPRKTTAIAAIRVDEASSDQQHAGRKRSAFSR